jgi:hypothetical protein
MPQHDVWTLQAMAFETLRERNISDARAKSSAELIGVQSAVTQALRAGWSAAPGAFAPFDWSPEGAAAFLEPYFAACQRR